jgi:hypothetical protein
MSETILPKSVVLFLIILLIFLMTVQEVLGEAIKLKFRRLHGFMILCIMLLLTFFMWFIFVQITQAS